MIIPALFCHSCAEDWWRFSKLKEKNQALAAPLFRLTQLQVYPASSLVAMLSYGDIHQMGQAAGFGSGEEIQASNKHWEQSPWRYPGDFLSLISELCWGRALCPGRAAGAYQSICRSQSCHQQEAGKAQGKVLGNPKKTWADCLGPGVAELPAGSSSTGPQPPSL